MPASPPLRSVVEDQKHDGATHSEDQPLVEADDLNGDELRRNARWTTAKESKERQSHHTCLSTPIESCRQHEWGSTTPLYVVFPRPSNLATTIVRHLWASLASVLCLDFILPNMTPVLGVNDRLLLVVQIMKQPCPPNTKILPEIAGVPEAALHTTLTRPEEGLL